MKTPKKITLVVAVILIFSMSAISGNQSLFYDANYEALLQNPASPCDGVDWKDHCNAELLPEYTCVVETENGTCKFGSMSNKDE
ncbi:MAG: hypothetical protein K9J25_13610 [Bacteroidales bacterium]|nr:hypothetical protein [Bacteroidales bacterium]